MKRAVKRDEDADGNFSCGVVAGLCIAAGAAVRWVRVERAMREGRPLPVPAIVPVLSLIVFAALALTATMILV